MVRNFHKIIHYVKDVHCLGNTFRMPVVLEAGTLFFLDWRHTGSSYSIKRRLLYFFSCRQQNSDMMDLMQHVGVRHTHR